MEFPQCFRIVCWSFFKSFLNPLTFSGLFVGVSSVSFLISVVKADFLKAVSKRLKAVKRLLYVVNRMNGCFKMRKSSVRLQTLNSLLTALGMSGAPSGAFLGHHLGHAWDSSLLTAFFSLLAFFCDIAFQPSQPYS